MSYIILILPRAQKELSTLPSPARKRIADAVRKLSDSVRPHGSVKLTGRNGWRIRTGDYRIIYEIDDAHHSVTVLHVGHRRDIYR